MIRDFTFTQRILTLFFIFINMALSQAQDKPAYQLFDQKGKVASYSKMIKQLEKADIRFQNTSGKNKTKKLV